MQPIEQEFDALMLDFVKNITIKGVAIGGYDKVDVFEQIKALVVKAREICVEIAGRVAQESRAAAADEAKTDTAKGAVAPNVVGDTQLASDNENFALCKGEWQQLESKLRAEIAKKEQELLAVKAQKETAEENYRMALQNLDMVNKKADALEISLKAAQSQNLQKQAAQAAAVPATNILPGNEREELQNLKMERLELKHQIAALQSENAGLKAAAGNVRPTPGSDLKAFQQADYILREARAERDQILAKAQSEADQKLLLGRAMRRREEEEAKASIAVLQDQSETLKHECKYYEDYINKMRRLLQEVEGIRQNLD